MSVVVNLLSLVRFDQHFLPVGFVGFVVCVGFVGFVGFVGVLWDFMTNKMYYAGLTYFFSYNIKYYIPLALH